MEGGEVVSLFPTRKMPKRPTEKSIKLEKGIETNKQLTGENRARILASSNHGTGNHPVVEDILKK